MHHLLKDNEALPREECWSLIERVADSAHLTRATRLREFLFYVGNKCLRENSTDIHEQEIGHVVFGREESYDTGQDNIVRVNATKLRTRIEDYFRNEGAAEPILFEIPRGSYVPVFRLRVKETPPVVEAPALPIAAAPVATRISPMLIAALALLAILCGWLLYRNSVLARENAAMNHVVHAWQGQPALAAFWPRFFKTEQPTNIILADTSFTFLEDVLKKPIPLSDYLDRSYLNEIKGPAFGVDRNILEMLVARNNGSYGDFVVAQQIESLDRADTNLTVTYARDYTVDAIKHNNVILIGSARSNPWVNLFTDRMNFTLDYDARLNQSFVANLHPQTGEQPRYSTPPTTVGGPLGYSLISYLPNSTHTADALIIAGTTSEATNAAGDFVTSQASMQSFLDRIHATKFPYFEILLKTQRLSGTPISAEIIAYRTY